MELAFAALKGNPYRADEHINTMRQEIVSTLVTLMEANIPISVPKKERTLTDVLQEAAAESASMLGSNAVAKGVSFFRDVKENISKKNVVRIVETYKNLFVSNVCSRKRDIILLNNCPR